MAVASAVLLGVTLVLVLVYALRPPRIPAGAPAKVKDIDWPFIGALGFWTKRSHFWRNGGVDGAFSFHVGREHVIALSSIEHRNAMIHQPKMDMAIANAFLFGTVPRAKGENGEVLVAEAGFGAWFLKRLRGLFDAKYLIGKTPLLIRDTNARLDAIGAELSSKYIYDTFPLIYTLVFQITSRATGANEVSDDWKWQDQMKERFFVFEKTFHPLYAIFPWLLTPTKIKKYWNAYKIYMDVKGIYEKRKKEDIREDDAFQYIIDKGEPADASIAFFITAVFAGQINTAINTAFCLYALALYPEWLEKVREELHDVASRHAEDPDASLVEQLSSLPYAVWVSEFPIMKQCLDETIRHTLFGVFARKNIAGQDVTLPSGVFVPENSFVVSSFSGSHTDPTIFPDPAKWDPGRFSPERAEHLKVPGAYLGWGAGRHVCGGIEFAHLEVFLVLSLFLARFDVKACHSNGSTEPTPGLPPMPHDAWGPSAPAKPYYIKLSRRSDSEKPARPSARRPTTAPDIKAPILEYTTMEDEED